MSYRFVMNVLFKIGMSNICQFKIDFIYSKNQQTKTW